MPVNINGTTGVESPGYTQGGDPIVGSGSNSDGNWTRWADGTQIARSNIPLLYDGVSPHVLKTNWNFPLSFVDNTYVVSFMPRESPPGGQDTIARLFMAFSDSRTSTGTQLTWLGRSTDSAAFGAGDSMSVSVYAIGLWK